MKVHLKAGRAGLLTTLLLLGSTGAPLARPVAAISSHQPASSVPSPFQLAGRPAGQHYASGPLGASRPAVARAGAPASSLRPIGAGVAPATTSTRSVRP